MTEPFDNEPSGKSSDTRAEHPAVEPEKTPADPGSADDAVSSRGEDREMSEEPPAAAQAEKPPAESANMVAEPATVSEGKQRPVDPRDADDVLTRRVADADEQDGKVLTESGRYTRRAFVVAGLSAAAGYMGYRELTGSPSRGMQPAPFREAFQVNAQLSRDAFRDVPLAPTYSAGKAETLRVNGVYGLKMQLKPESWRLQTVGVKDAETNPRYSKDVTAWTYEYETEQSKEDAGHDTKVDPKMLASAKMAPASMLKKAIDEENHTRPRRRGQEEAGESRSTLLPGTPGLLLQMDDILRLPRHELVTQFKCIEGWSQIVRWAGVRMADFLEAYPPELIEGREPRFVYMETPNGDYYTGYDLHALRHPQALLVTEMMGAPLTQFHGAPLRLHMPTKYGYKQIKRIGLISYTDSRPDDYWTKLGYDWYGGL